MPKVLKSGAELKGLVETELHKVKNCDKVRVVIGQDGPPDAHGWTVSHAEAEFSRADHSEIEAALRKIVPPLQAKYRLA